MKPDNNLPRFLNPPRIPEKPTGYVIQSSGVEIKKDGTKVIHTSYFEKHVGKIYAFNVMSDLDGAMRFDTRAEAMAARRKYFYNRKGTKIIHIK